MPATSPSPTTFGRLPAPRTGIIGRGRECADVIRLLERDSVPLVTLTGPGGVGKTRLAIELAQASVDRFAGGVAFVSLSNISDPDLVLPAAARAMNVNPVTGQDISETIRLAIGESDCLLVLDNFEQVMNAASRVALLLESTPRLKILATSRSPLRVTGEHEYPVEPLSLRPEEDSERNGAIALFMERATAVLPSFALTPRILPVIAEICARLDGLPLALELAAPRLRLLSPEALLERLDQRLTILSSGARDAPERQQTLRNAINWSYDLLDPSTRTLFRRLAIFAGGFTVDAAEAVVGIIPDSTSSVLEGIAELVDQSLLRRIEAPGGESRVVMLHTIRDFAVELLEEAGEWAAASDAHAQYIGQQIEIAANALKTPEEIRAYAWFNAELDNTFAAIEWMISRGDKIAAVSILAGVSRLWSGRIALGKMDDWLDRALALPGELPPRLMFDGHFSKSWIATFSGDNATALMEATRALEIAPSTGRPADRAKARNLLGGIAFREGDVDAAASHFEEALRIAEETGETTHLQSLNSNLGIVAQVRREFSAAKTRHERAYEASMAHGDLVLAAVSRLHLGHLAYATGDVRGAWQAVRLALPTLASSRHDIGLAETLWLESVIAYDLGEVDHAVRCAETAFGLNDGIGIADGKLSTEFDLRVDEIRRFLASTGKTHFSTPHSDEVDATVAAVLAFQFPAEEIAAPVPRNDDGLTARELDIVRSIALGRTNQEIADELFISLRTVQTHVSNILPKLKLTSRSAVAAYAVRRGIG